MPCHRQEFGRSAKAGYRARRALTKGAIPPRLIGSVTRDRHVTGCFLYATDGPEIQSPRLPPNSAHEHPGYVTFGARVRKTPLIPGTFWSNSSRPSVSEVPAAWA